MSATGPDPHSLVPSPTVSRYYAEGSAYEREKAGAPSGEMSRRYSEAARALHGGESMEGVAGARSLPVTGAWRACFCRSCVQGGRAHARNLSVFACTAPRCRGERLPLDV